MHILLVEDDVQASEFVSERLRRSGHVVTCRHDAESALKTVREHTFDAIVMDRMLPGLDGLSAIQRLRQGGATTPILMLTALSDISNRTEGLFAGADDYLCKPFAMEELMARLFALTRRVDAGGRAAATLQVGDLVIDRQGRRVTRGGRRIDLVAKEFEVLDYLALHAEQVVTRTMLLQEVWKLNFDPGTNIVESQISRLRAKLDEAGDQKLIHTTRGQGYVLRAA